MTPRPLPCIFYIVNLSLSPKSYLPSKLFGNSLQMIVVHIWIFPDELLLNFTCVFPESYSPWSACFSNVASATFTGNTIDAIHSLLWSPYWSHFHKRIFQGVSHFKNSSYIVSVCYMFKLFRSTSYVLYRYKTKCLNHLLQMNIFLRFIDN